MPEMDENVGQVTESGDEQQQQQNSRSIDSVVAEMNRKTSKLAEQNENLTKQLEQLVSAMQSSQQPQRQEASSASDEDDLESLAYSNPKKYAAEVAKRAEQRALNLINSQLQQQQATNATLAQLASDYPELNDGGSELTKRAVEIYKNLPASERQSTIAYKAAVRDAAAELGILPKAKRQRTTDDMPNISSGNTKSPRSSKADAELDPRTLEFAKMIGLNVNDKKVVENLKQRAKRSKWSKYE